MQVETAIDVAAARSAIASSSPDVVLLDLCFLMALRLMLLPELSTGCHPCQ